MAHLLVLVQEEDFDVAALQGQLLQGNCEEGGIATFTGYVRANNMSRDVHSMELEHYPGMTEKSIAAILDEAAQRWTLQAAIAVHRVGRLTPGDRIVWVGASSAHREAAFAACEFIMDYLKTRATFWKKEIQPGQSSWLKSRDSDVAAARRWEK